MKLNKLEKEVLTILENSNTPVGLATMVEKSNITKYDRRMGRCVLSLIDKHKIRLSKQSHHLSAGIMYELINN